MTSRSGRLTHTLRQISWRPFCLPVIAAILALPAQAAPKASTPEVLDEYRGRVADTFKATLAPDVPLSVIFEPSFEPEFAVGLRREKSGRTVIFVLKATRQIWGYSVLKLMRQGEIEVRNNDGSSGTAEAMRRIQDGLPPDPKALQVATCRKPISDELAQRITDDWRAMMLKSRLWAVPTSGLDGEFLTFSMRLDGAVQHARVWSPHTDTEAGQLTSLAYAMKSYCGTQSDADLNTVEQTSRDLKARLEADARSPER